MWHILKEDTRLFTIAEKRLRGKENDVKSTVDAIETEKVGTEATKQYEKKTDLLLFTVQQEQQKNCILNQLEFDSIFLVRIAYLSRN
jgi:hemerythrin-like domain-containing protein